MSDTPDLIELIENRNELYEMKYQSDKTHIIQSPGLGVDIPKQILPFQDKKDHIVPHQTIVSELWN